MRIRTGIYKKEFFKRSWKPFFKMYRNKTLIHFSWNRFYFIIDLKNKRP